MQMTLTRFFAALLSFFVSLFSIAKTGPVDTPFKFEKSVKAITAYTNTVETAVPQTEVYNIINQHFSSALPEGKTEKKAIVIGYDGCRADALGLIDGEGQGALSFMLANGGSVELSYAGGKNYPYRPTQHTSTGPGWCSMLTGKWGTETGVKDNGDIKRVEYKTNLVSLVEGGKIDSSAFYVSWDGHFVDDGSTYGAEKEYADANVPTAAFVDAEDDAGTLANVLDDIGRPDCSDYIFSILEHTDHTGHSSGFTLKNPAYRQAFADCERDGREIINAILDRPTCETEDWLVLVTTDHGGVKNYHGGDTFQERMTFIAVFSPNPAHISPDTVEGFKRGVGAVGAYTNTIETAVPQTEVYNIINQHFASALPEGKTEKKAIVIGYDGCRADTLGLIDSEGQGALSFMLANGGSVELSYAGGANYPDEITQSTSTGPGWCSMLTGKWGTETGVKYNGDIKPVEHKTNLLSLIEDGRIDSSAFYVSWDGHFVDGSSTYKAEKEYADANVPAAVFSDAADDAGTLANVLNDIGRPDCSDYIFLIFEHTDHTGHSSGFTPENPAYRQAFADSERDGREIINAIHSRPTYGTEDWLVLITTDHGGIDYSHGGSTIQERITFIATQY